MIPKKECPNCEHFKKKQHLTKTNQVITKEYCQRFNQELFSHQACPKFRYHEDLEVDVDSIYGKIAAFSGMLMMASFIAVIVALVANSHLAVWISGTIAVISMISLAIFMVIEEKREKKILYGDSAKYSGDDDESD